MQQRLNYLIAGSFVALIFLTIIFVTAILPATTFQPEKSEAATDYTPKEARGREIYLQNGCVYCHTQFVRYQDREYGEMVKAGDYVNDTPHVLGTERTGPDLSNVGGKFPDEWHWAHFMNPRKVKPGSIMPSFSYLSQQEMSDLIAYVQTLGRNRQKVAERGSLNPEWKEGMPEKDKWLSPPIHYIEPPQQLRDEWKRISETKDVSNSAFANAGRGIYMQNCAVCHGVNGKGNGPDSVIMLKKPANFNRSYFSAYTDAMWYYRVKEGVVGTRMPRWGKTLSEEQMAYLVAYLKTLPKDPSTPSGNIEVTDFNQVDQVNSLDRNYQEIEALNKAADEKPYVYGRGRSD